MPFWWQTSGLNNDKQFILLISWLTGIFFAILVSWESVVVSTKEVKKSAIECCKMTGKSLPEALKVLSAFLSQDEYYLDTSKVYGDGGRVALEKALVLFLNRPDLGFVWMAYDGNEPVGICVVCFAISTSIGGIVAKLDDVFVATDRQNQGIGSLLLAYLKEELRQLGVRRIDTSVHFQNNAARRFYTKHDFLSLSEERLSCVL